MTKISKEAARYEPEAKGEDECRDCKHFDRPYWCERVEGKIEADGWCKLFERKSRMAEAMKHG